MSYNQFAKKGGLSSAQMSRVTTGQRSPPLERINVWADLLELHGEDRSQFVELAHLAHCPLFIVERYQAMQLKIEKLTKRA
jgi:hypothetical protein